MNTFLRRSAGSLGFVGRALALSLICSLLPAQPTFHTDIDGFRMNLNRATVIHGSASPNKEWSIFHVNYRDLTAYAFVFGNVDRKTIAGFAPTFPSVTSGRLDRQPTNAFQVIWSEDSTLAAIHDSGEKHSKLNLFRVSDGKFAALQLPDLLKAGFPEIQPDQQPHATSGQVPVRWLTNDRLLVNVRLRFQNETKQQPLEVHVPHGELVTVTNKLVSLGSQ